MRCGNRRGVEIIETRWPIEPLLDTQVLAFIEFEALDQTGDEDPLLRFDLEICPRKGADEFN